jgi:hypothetical protein
MRLVAFGIAGLGVPVALLVTGLAANAVYLAVTAVAG